MAANKETVELRGDIPRRLAAVLDAKSRPGQSRFAVALEWLEERQAAELNEARRLLAVVREAEES
jgi:hypothetical protein